MFLVFSKILYFFCIFIFRSKSHYTITYCIITWHEFGYPGSALHHTGELIPKLPHSYSRSIQSLTFVFTDSLIILTSCLM